jgi:mannosyltransferase OCH1-like enzyme
MVKHSRKKTEKYVKSNINELYKSAIKEIQVKNQKIKDIDQTQTIPKIIHYLWISNKDNYINVELPDKYTKFVNTWYKNYN